MSVKVLACGTKTKEDQKIRAHNRRSLCVTRVMSGQSKPAVDKRSIVILFVAVLSALAPKFSHPLCIKKAGFSLSKSS